MMPPLAVPRPPQAAALQAATRLPVRATALRGLISEINADLDEIEASCARVGAMFAQILGDDEDLWPAPVESGSVLGAAGDPAGSWARWSQKP